MKRLWVLTLLLAIVPTIPAQAAHSDVLKESSWIGDGATDGNGSHSLISELSMRDDDLVTLRLELWMHDETGAPTWNGYIEFFGHLKGTEAAIRLRQKGLFFAKIRFNANVCLWTEGRDGARSDGCYEPRGDGLEVDVTLTGYGPYTKTLMTDPSTGIITVEKTRAATAIGRISFDDEIYPDLNWNEFAGTGQLFIERVRT